mgnify:FL=1
MKKITFIIFFLFIITLTIPLSSLKNTKITCQNTKKDNIEAHYPTYNINKLDTYIKNHINNIINNTSSNNNLYIDYDTINNKDNIKTIIYTYIDQKGLIKNNITEIDYNIKTKNITKDIKIITTSNNYNIVNNKVIDKNKKIISFTFDDGPSYNTIKIANILKKYNATATFFVLGNKVEKYEKTLKYLKDNNMEIGNHTYTHKFLSKLKEEDIMLEINNTQEEIYRVTNTYPTLFRPSYGTVSNKLRRLSPMPLIIWNLDTLDWKYHNSNKIANKILNKVKDGDIILMHDTYSATVNAVNIVIPKLIEQGYEIVSVSELFYYKNIIPTYGKYYGHIN